MKKKKLPHCKYVTLHSSCGVHMDTYISTQLRQHTETSSSHATATYVFETDMPIKCHIYATYANYLMFIYDTCLCILYAT